MKSNDFSDSFLHVADGPRGIDILRTLILQLAFQGKLGSTPSESWHQTTVGEIGDELVPGFACSKKNEDPNGYVHLRTHNVGKNGRLNFDLVVKVNQSKIDCKKGSIRAGDVIFNNTNSQELVGKTCLVDQDYPYAFSNHLTILRFKGRVSPAFFVRYFNLLLRQGTFSRLCNRWIGQAGINTKALRRIQIAVPAVEEQDAIVAKVDALLSFCDDLERRQGRRDQVRVHLNDGALERLVTASDPTEFAAAWQRVRDNFDLLYAVPENVAKLRQAILQLAVQGKLVPQDPSDEPASNIVARLGATPNERTTVGRRRLLATIKSEEVAKLPSDRWTWARLGELADIVSGVAKGRNLNGKNTRYFPYLRVANVQAGFLDLTEVKEIEIPIEELAKYRLDPGDLLLTEGGDWDKLGRSAIWDGQIENCIHQNHVFRARLLAEVVRPRWIKLFTNSPVGRAYFQNAAKQTTNLASINMTQLSNCPVLLPPTAQQDRILARVDAIMAICDSLETELNQQRDHADRLAQAIVNAVVTGKMADGNHAQGNGTTLPEQTGCRALS